MMDNMVNHFLITSLEIVPDQLYYSLGWAVFSEILYRLTPMPPKIKEKKDIKERSKDLAYMTSSIVGGFHSIVGCILALIAIYKNGGVDFDRSDFNPYIKSTLQVTYP